MSCSSKWGTLFLLIGNSGSGKDSLIRWVLEKWPSTKIAPFIPTRVITRPPSPETEDFESVTEEEFQNLLKAGAFSLHWVSYSISYGVRIEIEEILSRGRSVLVNVSRQIVDTTRKQFPNIVSVIFVKVPFNVTEARIRARGREKGIKLDDRIKRARENQEFPDADFIVDNSGDLDTAGSQLLEFLINH